MKDNTVAKKEEDVIIKMIVVFFMMYTFNNGIFRTSQKSIKVKE